MDEKKFDKEIKRRLESFTYSGEPSTGAMDDFMSRIGSAPATVASMAVWKTYLAAAAMVASVAFNVYLWRLYNHQSKDISELKNALYSYADSVSREGRVDTVYVYEESSAEAVPGNGDTINRETVGRAMRGADFVTNRRDAAPADVSRETAESHQQAVLTEYAGFGPLQAKGVWESLPPPATLSLTNNDLREIWKIKRQAISGVVPEKKPGTGLPLSAGLNSGIVYPANKFVRPELSAVVGATVNWRATSRWRLGVGVESYNLRYSFSPPLSPPNKRPRHSPHFDSIPPLGNTPYVIKKQSEILEIPVAASYFFDGDAKKVNPFVGVGYSVKVIRNQQTIISHNTMTEKRAVSDPFFAPGALNLSAGLNGRFTSKMSWQLAATWSKDVGPYGVERTQFENLKLQAGLTYNFF